MDRLKAFISLLESGMDPRRACIDSGFLSFDECRQKLLGLADSLPTGRFPRETNVPEAGKNIPHDSGQEALVIHTDGASRGNPGPASAAAVAFSPAGEKLASRCVSLGTATNNEAEYKGLILGLKLAGELGARRIILRMDSELVVKQMKGEYKVKNSRLGELAAEARRAASFFELVVYEHVSRDRNLDADRLAGEVLDSGDPTV